MQQAGYYRVGVVALILILSLWTVWGTVRYFGLVEGGASPEQLKEFRENNQAITFHLDLAGGLEVVGAIKRNDAINQQVAHWARQIRDQLGRENITVKVQTVPEKLGIQLTLSGSDGAGDLANAAACDAILRKNFDYLEYDRDGLLKTGSALLAVSAGTQRRIIRDGLQSAQNSIQKRLNTYGLTNPSVVVQGEDRIKIQIPGTTTIHDASSTGTAEVSLEDKIFQPAVLEFREVHQDSVLKPGQTISDKVREMIQPEYQIEVFKPGQTTPKVIDFKYDPVTKKFNVPFIEGQRPDPGWEFVPGYTTHQDQKTATWFLVKEEPEMDGMNLRNARAEYNPGQALQSNASSPYFVSIEFNARGTQEFYETTKDLTGKPLGILLDGICYSAPNVNEPIPSGNAIITGSFTPQETQDLALILKAGSNPTPMEVIYERLIEPKLGAVAIKRGITSLLIGAIIVLIFMTFYYRLAGIIADIAVLINVVTIFAILAWSNATLSLSGIAGILLTIGMAVDANVLIYERIREEMKTAKSWRLAVQNGFSRAFWTIFDANLTTLITALVLLQIGTGSVRGFGITMTIGILITLYTGLFVTRVLFDIFSGNKGISVGTWTMFPDNVHFNILGLRKAAYAFSLILLGIGFFAIFMHHGIDMSVEFTGGSEAQIEFTDPSVTANGIRKNLKDVGFPIDVQPTKFKSENGEGASFSVRMKALKNKAGGDDLKLTADMFDAAIAKAYPNGAEVVGHGAISSEVAGEFIRIAILNVLIAAALILVYVAFRFEFRFGVAAVIALFHDLFITIGFLALFKEQISLEIVAALLVVMGYSLNDTIIIFDRIREMTRTVFGAKYEDILNLSISRSLNRTTITSLTTLITTLILCFYGGEALRGFALTLCIGIAVGTYSSSFVATPVLYMWQKGKGGHGGGSHGRKEDATASQARTSSKGSTAAGRARTIES
ncbi:protein translocase subunit SecD [Candidatus Sumerlaeota bacterium]|nr:protein translocase subunit SecD [Candidatus Sumerlaeota bacterium]